MYLLRVTIVLVAIVSFASLAIGQNIEIQVQVDETDMLLSPDGDGSSMVVEARLLMGGSPVIGDLVAWITFYAGDYITTCVTYLDWYYPAAGPDGDGWVVFNVDMPAGGVDRTLVEAQDWDIFVNMTDGEEGGQWHLRADEGLDLHAVSPDFNASLSVSLSDISIFTTLYYNQTYDLSSDLNSDGLENLADLQMFTQRYGAICP